MEKLDIRDYLYHGIHNGVYKGSAPDPGLAVFESILKDGYLLCGKELNERGVYSKVTYYTAEMGWTPRISLGFYPLNDEIYKISFSTSKCSQHMPKSIKEFLTLEHGFSEEKLGDSIIDHPFSGDDIAWLKYSRGITLIFDPKLLEDLKISNYAALYDEICVDEKVSLRKYLVAVSLFLDIRKAEDFYDPYSLEVLNVRGYVYERIYDKYFIEIKKLLAKYDYDVPVIDFLTGKPLDNHGKVLVRVKRNKESTQ